jgi:hypothetical protein
VTARAATGSGSVCTALAVSNRAERRPAIRPDGPCGTRHRKDSQHGDKTESTGNTGAGAYAAACAALTAKVHRMGPPSRHRHDSCVPRALVLVSVLRILAVPRTAACDRQVARPVRGTARSSRMPCGVVSRIVKRDVGETPAVTRQGRGDVPRRNRAAGGTASKEFNHRCTQMHADGPESAMSVHRQSRRTGHGEPCGRDSLGPIRSSGVDFPCRFCGRWPAPPAATVGGWFPCLTSGVQSRCIRQTSGCDCPCRTSVRSHRSQHRATTMYRH